MTLNMTWAGRTAAALLAGFLWSGAAQAAACDRACLSGHADDLLASVAAHDPGRLPLVHAYRATENGVAAGLPMMEAWTTATGIGQKYYIIDPVSEQLFFIAELKEGARSALYTGRFKIEDGRFSEIETNITRSRGDTGYMWSADHVAHPAPEWLAKVERSRIPSRAQLQSWGRSAFDTSIATPPSAPNCVLMENGRIVEENAEVANFVSTNAGAVSQKARTTTIPCGAPPNRPTDAQARTDIIDEEQGITVSLASVHGIVEPSLVENPTISVFVPDQMLAPYIDLMNKWKGTRQAELPAVVPTRASILVAELHRYYDGKLQGLYLIEKLGPPGGVSPWNAR